jgi:hypothetical protein
MFHLTLDTMAWRMIVRLKHKKKMWNSLATVFAVFVHEADATRMSYCVTAQRIASLLSKFRLERDENERLPEAYDSTLQEHSDKDLRDIF